MDKGENLWLRKKGCDSETQELDLPSVLHLSGAVKQWYMEEVKNERSP